MYSLLCNSNLVGRDWGNKAESEQQSTRKIRLRMIVGFKNMSVVAANEQRFRLDVDLHLAKALWGDAEFDEEGAALASYLHLPLGSPCSIFHRCTAVCATAGL